MDEAVKLVEWQARLEEANWWRNYFPIDATQYDVRIAELKWQVKELQKGLKLEG